MKKTPYLGLVIGVQLASLAFTICIYAFGLAIPMAEEQSQMLGGNITMILMVLSAVAHFQAKKGICHPALVTVLGLAAPTAAFISVLPRYVVTYHLVALGVHLFIIWGLAKAAEKSFPQQGPSSQDSPEKAGHSSEEQEP